MRVNSIEQQFNKHSKESFDAYFEDIVKQEEKEMQEIGQAYMDTYNLYVTEQEEDWNKSEDGLKEVRDSIRDSYE